MATEIERKFLVSGEFKSLAVKALPISQAYLASTSRCTVRVRTKGDRGFITIKGKSDAAGMSRFEWEKEIPAEEAEALMLLGDARRISKTRYLIPNTDGKHTWEVDEFYGDNEGLVMAEIELSSEDEPFDKPSWLGEEVTGDRRYYNSHLLQYPFKSWK